MKTRNTKTAAEIKEVRDFLRDRAFETGYFHRFDAVDFVWDIMMSIETYESCGVSAEDVVSLLKERLTFDVDFYENMEREEMKNATS